MAVGDHVICFKCKAMGKLVQEEGEGKSYRGVVECKECGKRLKIINPPKQLGTIRIHTAPEHQRFQKRDKVQQEFTFVQSELKKAEWAKRPLKHPKHKTPSMTARTEKRHRHAIELWRLNMQIAHSHILASVQQSLVKHMEKEEKKFQ